MSTFRIGCAVWAYKGWVGDLYPPKTPQHEFFENYVARLTAVEGNSMFYAIPSAEQVAQWAAGMPPGFEIFPKLHRSFTHEGPLVGRGREIAAFRERMQGFGAHLGALMAQLPPTYGPERLEDLATFLDAWPHDEIPLSLEVRHLGWWVSHHATRLFDLLHHHGVSRVLLDTRPIYSGRDDPQRDNERKKPRLPMTFDRPAPFVVVRYIGHQNPARNEPFLNEWADWITEWRAEGIDVTFFAHCPTEAFSPGIARRLQALLEARGADVPPLPWNTIPATPKQASLF